MIGQVIQRGVRLAIMIVGVAGGVAAPAAAGTVERVDLSRLEALIADGVTVVDIRRPEEWRATGVIPGSHLLTAYDENGRLIDGFVTRAAELAGDGKPLALICRTGNRSASAARLLAAHLPAVTIFDIAGGVRDWQATGHTLVPCPTC